ncbi:hypothetical protein KQX54_003459 [Cotesia glomerata]|uniref:Uncharacterized protein n=1 Tax=Cotesia glomerata TaxID=32391 RepID=A0AAV7ICL5_COTGL|nr:hypothetical protein KQX54_003459 [Cotesia glomerata]
MRTRCRLLIEQTEGIYQPLGAIIRINILPANFSTSYEAALHFLEEDHLPVLATRSKPSKCLDHVEPKRFTLRTFKSSREPVDTLEDMAKVVDHDEPLGFQHDLLENPNDRQCDLLYIETTLLTTACENLRL